MNYRQINTSREIRQWAKIGLQAVTVTVGCLMMYATNDNFRDLSDGIKKTIKDKIDNRKKES